MPGLSARMGSSGVGLRRVQGSWALQSTLDAPKEPGHREGRLAHGEPSAAHVGGGRSSPRHRVLQLAPGVMHVQVD